MKRSFACLIVTAALVGCTHSPASHSHATGNAAPGTQAQAVDLHNTVCPVSGDDVGSSKLTETYQGKVYHLCCKDCPKDFRQDPKKYADAVAADPAKYGVK